MLSFIGLVPFLSRGVAARIHWRFPVMSRSNRKRDCAKAGGGVSATVPAGTPDWITAELIEQTIRVWQPYYQAVLTAEEAVTMILNVGRLYDVLSSGSSP